VAEPVTLTLSRDEAVVLFEWLHRFNSETAHRFDDQAEQRVFWDLEASLEASLEELLQPEHAEILAAARSRVRDPIE
jgi:HPt (histidine-containing phosphotransfer) domain-containing protein